MTLKDNVKPITYLKNNAAELLRHVSEEGQPVMITQNGEAKAVLIDIETYDRWRDAMALLKVVAQGEGDVAAGRLVSQKKALQRAASVLRAAQSE
jgi:prevent-host-death family protein